MSSVEPGMDASDATTSLYATAKRKVGRPVTSERTLSRNFPEIEDIRGKLLTGECYARMRTSGSSSEVWQLFEEIAYSVTQEFTGIVRCKTCQFMTRYHGQITGRTKQLLASLTWLKLCSSEGTSHMRRHHCFREAFPEVFANTGSVVMPKIKRDVKPIPKVTVGRHSLPYSLPMSSPLVKPEVNGHSPALKSLTNNKIAAIKSEFRERVLQLCYNELITLESVTSESFKALVQTLIKLCTTVGKCTINLPDVSQLTAQMTGQYTQTKHRIKEELNLALSRNVGAALVCDSENDLCVISSHYISQNWTLVESVLSATSRSSDINSFISETLIEFGLHDDNLSKLTFVSRGGLFDGVGLCLTSMAHVIDGVIESAIFCDETYTEIVENCKVICNELRLEIEDLSIDWVNRFELMKNVIDNQHKFELKNSSLDLSLIKFLVDFLSPFRAAAVELRQCSRHPTLNHVLLWYYKLMKHLNAIPENNDIATHLVTLVRIGMQENFKLEPIHKISAFLWPNFRFLKMLSNEERIEVHNEIRVLIESRVMEENTVGDQSEAKKSRSEFDEWEDANDDDMDEVNKYISVQLTTCNEQNILTWWREHQNDFPKLAQLAKWILAIPASVTSLERFQLDSAQCVGQDLLFMHCYVPFRRSFVMDKSVKSSWKTKMLIKNEKKRAKETEQEIKAAKQRLIEEKRIRREENLRRKEENTRKAEITQAIRNPKKLKRMAKKQMKQMRKVRKAN